MRLMMLVTIPHDPFNQLVRKGTIGETIERILDATKPESVYFVEENGQRGAVLIINVNDASEIPRIAEPWFLDFNAHVRFRIALTLDDLHHSGLEEAGKKWG